MLIITVSVSEPSMCSTGRCLGKVNNVSEDVDRAT